MTVFCPYSEKVSEMSASILTLVERNKGLRCVYAAEILEMTEIW